MLEKLKAIFQIQTISKNKVINRISLIGVILSILGIIDTTSLTISHYAKLVLACPTTTFINCVKVTSSSYSEVFGIPIAFFGLLFFIGMLIVQLPIFWKSAAKWFVYLRLAFAVSGVVTVFWLVYVELHILHSICLYCTGVHILTFGLFITTIIGTSLISPEILKLKQKTSSQE